MPPDKFLKIIACKHSSTAAQGKSKLVNTTTAFDNEFTRKPGL